MKPSKIALNFYFLFCFLAILADVFQLDSLLLFTIPLVIPSLFFYYYIESNRIKFLVCTFLLANFIGDAFGLMNFENEIYYIVLPFFISNSIILFYLIKNLERLKFTIVNFFSLTIFSLFLGYLWFVVVGLFSDDDSLIQVLVGIFGAVVFLIGVFGSYNLIAKLNSSNLFLMFSILCVIISEVFYMIHNFQNQLLLLDSIHFGCQIISYLFFIKFILIYENQNNTIENE